MNAASSFGSFFFEEGSFGVFLLVTVMLGGGAATLAGRAVAATWRPWWQVVAYALILGLAVRFIHFSLFGGTLLSPHYYLVDSAFCMAFGISRLPHRPRRPDGRALSLDHTSRTARCAGAASRADVMLLSRYESRPHPKENER